MLAGQITHISQAKGMHKQGIAPVFQLSYLGGWPCTHDGVRSLPGQGAVGFKNVCYTQ
jgi:hypothetical protein